MKAADLWEVIKTLGPDVIKAIGDLIDMARGGAPSRQVELQARKVAQLLMFKQSYRK